jgi:hypothetical protein
MDLLIEKCRKMHPLGPSSVADIWYWFRSIKFVCMEHVEIYAEAGIFEKFNVQWLPPIYSDL